MAIGSVFDIEEFGIHDGPGKRKIVFFKGCNLECNWCHNPEGISFEKETITTKDGVKKACGKKYNAKDLAKFLRKGEDVLSSTG
ncbi:MAG: 4Fe-4S cluster-binding domain-containing protein, partial [Bacteroidales bacterium]|nr:4Fe-4S cluster-binding domain-containing protein [Bacteroidales bacterium]